MLRWLVVSGVIEANGRSLNGHAVCAVDLSKRCARPNITLRHEDAQSESAVCRVLSNVVYYDKPEECTDNSGPAHVGHSVHAFSRCI